MWVCLRDARVVDNFVDRDPATWLNRSENQGLGKHPWKKSVPAIPAKSTTYVRYAFGSAASLTPALHARRNTRFVHKSRRDTDFARHSSARELPDAQESGR